MPKHLNSSDNAANKVRQLRDSEGNQDLMLRVYVTGVVVQVFLMVLTLLKTKMKTMQNLSMVM